MVSQNAHSVDHVWRILEKVKDPEIPVLTISELGILREVKIENGVFNIAITPTYVGCPAMDMIKHYIALAMDEEGIENYLIESQLFPAWTTEWMSEEAREKLRKYGIAPPSKGFNSITDPLGVNLKVDCPKCESSNTKLVSHFGATSCKSQFQCLECQEPFEYFKCH